MALIQLTAADTGKRIAVNPEQVQYVKQLVDGGAEIAFASGSMPTLQHVTEKFTDVVMRLTPPYP